MKFAPYLSSYSTIHSCNPFVFSTYSFGGMIVRGYDNNNYVRGFVVDSSLAITAQTIRTQYLFDTAMYTGTVKKDRKQG